MGVLLGLAWWGMFELIASGAVCTFDDWGCLSTFVTSVPIFAVVAAVAGGFALRWRGESRAWLVAVPATLMAVVVMIFLLAVPWTGFAVFAALYALLAFMSAPREGSVESSRELS